MWQRVLSTVIAMLTFLCTDAQQKDKIQINQLGYYPLAPKIAVVTTETPARFFIVKSSSHDTVFSGTLREPHRSSNSSLITCVADFSSLRSPGQYTLVVPLLGNSYPFSIANNVHSSVARSSLKGFYYQRSDMPLEKKYAGKWARSAGHRDTAVIVHASAATPDRPEGTEIATARGWYDAGDYNKYIVNSGITMGTLLSAYEDFPAYFNSLRTSIPESNNAIPDILDEILYNLRWMLSMQDPFDGGVYNKCTNAAFDGMVMPGVTTLPRYVVQKGTAATLDFAAVMAQASRIFTKFKKQLPGLGDTCLNAARAAWQWAQKNPSLAYDQQAMNKAFDPDITTGGYGDRNFSDEWYWAAVELFITTKDQQYFAYIGNQKAYFSLPSWAGVGMLGHYTLIRNRKNLSSSVTSLVAPIQQYLVRFADSLINNSETNAFKTVIGGSARDFVWGSNSVAANQSILLLNVYLFSKDEKYIRAALTNLDYILGRNATGFCFVTGAGTHSTLHPHHRPSVADGIVEPVPGLLAGGPNPGRQDRCEYAFTEPETAYSDTDCSYASNEIAINWNAPLVYLANAIEALQYMAGFSRK
jgi:endoglucanase